MAATVLWENEHVRVLRHDGAPSDPSAHPNSVVVALADGATASWLPAQQRTALDVGDAIVVELKGSRHEPAATDTESAFALSDAEARALFGDAIVDARIPLTPEDPDAGRWDAEVSYTSPMERYRGWSAVASVGVNVLTGRWSFSCDVDEPATCVHSYALMLAALEDENFTELIEKGLAELG